MRVFGFLLLLAFGFNLLSEMKENLCQEFESPASIAQVSMSADLHEIHEPSNSSVAAHDCHFGHCAHLLLKSATKLSAFAPTPILWIALPAQSLFRYGLPEERPPIRG